MIAHYKYRIISNGRARLLGNTVIHVLLDEWLLFIQFSVRIIIQQKGQRSTYIKTKTDKVMVPITGPALDTPLLLDTLVSNLTLGVTGAKFRVGSRHFDLGYYTMYTFTFVYPSIYLSLYFIHTCTNSKEDSLPTSSCIFVLCSTSLWSVLQPNLITEPWPRIC